MKTFQQFMHEHDSSGSLMKVAAIAIEENLDEVLDFFRQLAHKNERIKHELDAFNRDDLNKPAKNHASDFDNDERDIVAPGSVDSSEPED